MSTPPPSPDSAPPADRRSPLWQWSMGVLLLPAAILASIVAVPALMYGLSALGVEAGWLEGFLNIVVPVAALAALITLAAIFSFVR
jgi:nitroreductase